MFEIVKNSIKWRKRQHDPFPEHEDGLKVRDHRAMVGGNWDVIGRHQFDYMVNEAKLKTDDYFLEIACGSFRAGRFFIPYLDAGHYMATEKQRVLVEEGRQKEIDAKVWEEKKPEILIDDQFQFHKLSRKPNVILAQSLFTHLTSKDIKTCLRNLYEFVEPGARFYATFHIKMEPVIYTLPSHSSRNYAYAVDEMVRFGRGWKATFIGNWGHPRNRNGRQQLMLYTKE